MDYITTTNLRTHSSKLIEALKKGKSVTLIHRSEIVGEIQPQKKSKPLTIDGIKKIQKLAEELNLPQKTYDERDKDYRIHLLKKYGKSIS